jgi:hypothetical protein
MRKRKWKRNKHIKRLPHSRASKKLMWKREWERKKEKGTRHKNRCKDMNKQVKNTKKYRREAVV